MAELLTLRLHQPISYVRRTGDAPRDPQEWIEIFRFDGVFDFSSPDGPEATLPGPSSLIDSGYAEPEGRGANASPDLIVLEAGSYLFRQHAEPPGFDLAGALREYIRDAWWEGRKPGGRLILRHVLEDGKRSIQFLCPL